MEGKFFLFLGLVLAGIAGTYFIFLEQDLDSLNTKLIVTRQNTTSYQGQIDQIKYQMQNKSTVAELVKSTASLKAEKEKITDEIKTLNEAHLDQVESLRTAIAQIRRETVGLSFDELVLTSGAPLKKAMIQEVSEDEIVIKHSLGIRRAISKEWPIALKERLRPGALADTKPVAVNEPMPASLIPNGEDARKKHAKKIAEAEGATSKMKRDLLALEQQLQQAESDLNTNLSASRKYYTEVRRNQFRSQVQALQVRIGSAEDALNRLRTEQPQ
jgi:predicted  nucleic acid-binding Zn-ribbon protein